MRIGSSVVISACVAKIAAAESLQQKLLRIVT